MVAGRELNQRIHEDVMGRCVHVWESEETDASMEEWSHVCEKCGIERTTGGNMLHPVSGLVEPYDRDISAAWLVWDKLIADGWYPDLVTHYDHDVGSLVYICELHRGGEGIRDHFSVQAKAAPLAICECALKSVGTPVTLEGETNDGN